ncbi:hypothetical protein, partial [Planktomarina sp.]|uniref:hypothetical protein n=1 Tax=Planktomarina sp. TaxID=2024851 RepID=UPI002891DA01|nr:hypothetical protein [Planktomarina sp.]
PISGGMGKANTMDRVSAATLLPQDDDFVHVHHALVTYSDDNLWPAIASVNQLCKFSDKKGPI